MDISHAGNALVGEGYPVTISVNNHDIRSLSLTMDVLLQPAEDETGTSDEFCFDLALKNRQ